jgi:hypothetical protein
MDSHNLIKMASKLIIRLFLSIWFTVGLVGAAYPNWFDEQLVPDALECPNATEFVSLNDDYTMECVEKSIPPWPLCLFHNITYFVNAAVSSASRCCDFDDLEDCRCPLKEYQHWQDVMGNWCEDIKTCPIDFDSVPKELQSDFWASFIAKLT